MPCILIGLSKAPGLSADTNSEGIISVKDIDFLVVPYNACGSVPVLEMSKLRKKIYAVKENNTILDVTPEKINVKCDIINSYEELKEYL